MSLPYICLIVLAIVGSTIALGSEYIPKSYYVIDHNGHKSDVVYFRSKRAVEMFPLFRLRRDSGASASSFSSASSSSSGSTSSSSATSSASAGSGAPVFFGNGGNPAFEFAQRFGGASGSSGNPAGNTGYTGPILFSRVGEDQGTGVKVTGNAQGEKGAFSASSSSIDSDGKITYSVQSGKY